MSVLMAEATELEVTVGSIITARQQEDRRAFEEECAMAKLVEEQLERAGINFDFLRRPGIEIWASGIDRLDALCHLQKLVAHLEQGEDITSLYEAGSALSDDIDSLIAKIWDGKAKTRFAHLLYLQGINSFYIPAIFATPVWLPFTNADDENDQAYFGSAAQLRDELIEIRAMFQRANISMESAAYRCLEVLYTATDQSMRSGLPVIIW
jgi:hypothetical protein